MLSSTLFIVCALAAVVWLSVAVLVAAMCRMASLSDAEIESPTRLSGAKPTPQLRVRDARPRAARSVARS
jgi:chemotaxis signal transduction protein